jgi:chordin
LTCPALSCQEGEAYRPDPMACCKQCPAAPATTTQSTAALLANKELLGEEAQARGEVDILSSGGCRFKGDVFENGEEWHPRIQPWGEMRCINCNCKVTTLETKFTSGIYTKNSVQKSKQNFDFGILINQIGNYFINEN